MEVFFGGGGNGCLPCFHAAWGDVRGRGHVDSVPPVVEEPGGDLFQTEFIEGLAEHVPHFRFIPKEEAPLGLLFLRSAGNIHFAAVIGMRSGGVSFGA